jgi:hypothetical protein
MNPELRRNLWLELSTHRLLAMPAVLVLVFVLFASRNVGDWAEIVFTTAIGFFIAIVHLWGTYKASEAVTDEVRDRTWDWQRLSALDPWRMTWGKLAGATAFTWYGAAICMVAMVVAALGGAERRSAAVYICGLVALGVMLQGAALAASLQASRKSSRLGHRVGVLIVFPVAAVALLTLTGAQPPRLVSIEWYGHEFESSRFYSALAVVLALWAVLGAYREMARELKMRLLPWAYPAFALFLAALIAGFAHESIAFRSTFALSGLLVSLTLAYYGIFADLTSAMSLRRLALHWKARHWRRFLEELPLWVPALAMAFAFALLCTQILSSSAEAPLAILPRSAGLYPFAVLLVGVRDCLLLVFFALAPRGRAGPEAVTLLYIALLSWILPAVLAIAGMGAVAKLLMPFGAFNGWQAALVMGVHVAIVAALIAWRWRRWGRAFRGA